MRIFRSQKIDEYSSVVFRQEQVHIGKRKSNSAWYKAQKSFRRHWQLYLIMVPALLYFLIFKYIPMASAVIAFKEYNVVQGVWGSPWVGFKYFNLFFSNPVFWTLIKNTLG